MDREILAYLIIAVLALAFAGLAAHAFYNSRERKASRQRERERLIRSRRKDEQG